MSLDQTAKKHALRLLHYNVVVVTAGTGEEIIGATVTFFMQSSMDPPLITMAIKADSRLYETLQKSRYFVANLVSRNDQKFASEFFKPRYLINHQMGQFDATAHEKGGAILEAAPVWIGCPVRTIVEEGDHHLVIGEIETVTVTDESKEIMCLSETGWHYGA